jgi:hypothetical protein
MKSVVVKGLGGYLRRRLLMGALGSGHLPSPSDSDSEEEEESPEDGRNPGLGGLRTGRTSPPSDSLSEKEEVKTAT